MKGYHYVMLLAVLLLSLWLINMRQNIIISLEEKDNIRWLGKIIFAEVDEDPFYTGKIYKFLMDDEVDIGLRSDGVVVWKLVEKETESSENIYIIE